MRIFTLLSLSFFLFGCATARISSFRDPSALNKTYSSVVVMYPIDNLSVRTKIESMAIESFTNSKVKAASSLTVYSPTKEFNESEFYQAVAKSGFETVLLVKRADSASKTSYSAITNYTGNSNYTYNSNLMGGGNLYGNHNGSAYTSLLESTTYNSNAQIELWDVKTKTRVWVGSVDGESGHYSSYDGMLEKMIDTTKEELIKASLLAPAVP